MRTLIKFSVTAFCLLLTSLCYGETNKSYLKKNGRKDAHMSKREAKQVSWETLSEATAASRKDGKPICLFFTGSDWCIWCVRMENQIIWTEEFATFCLQYLHPVKVDFPQKTSLDESLKAQNRSLKQKYDVHGLPEMVFTDADGTVLARLGYEQGGPTHFIDKVKKELSVK